jgi:hypothetical protein
MANRVLMTIINNTHITLNINTHMPLASVKPTLVLVLLTIANNSMEVPVKDS